MNILCKLWIYEIYIQKLTLTNAIIIQIIYVVKIIQRC